MKSGPKTYEAVEKIIAAHIWATHTDSHIAQRLIRLSHETKDNFYLEKYFEIREAAIVSLSNSAREYLNN